MRGLHEADDALLTLVSMNWPLQSRHASWGFNASLAAMDPLIHTPQLTNTLQSILIACYCPARRMDDGNVDGPIQAKAKAQAKINGLLSQLDAERMRHGGQFFMGETVT